MSSVAYIDGDIILYQAAFSGEVKFWAVPEECIEFRKKRDALAFVASQAENGVSQTSLDSSVIEVRERLPFGNVKRKAASLLEGCLRALRPWGVSSYQMYLTHPDRTLNYRYKVAKTHEYKGNRRQSSKPLWYEETYEHLRNRYKAEVIKGIEADDAVASSAFCDNGVMVTIDKDLLMVPGKWFNINTHDMVECYDPGYLELVEGKLKGCGFIWFCAQVLMGDRVDNIVGLHNVGPVKAFKILDPFQKNADPGVLLNIVMQEYYKRGHTYARFRENCDLLWIRRKWGQSFTNWLQGTMK